MSAMASEITGVSIVYSTVCSDADQRKHQSSVSLAFVRAIHRWPVNSLRKWVVTRKVFRVDDVIMFIMTPSYPFYYLRVFLYRAIRKKVLTFSQSNWTMNFVLLRRRIHPPMTRNQQTEDFAAFLEHILLKDLNEIPLFNLYGTTVPVESTYWLQLQSYNKFGSYPRQSIEWWIEILHVHPPYDTFARNVQFREPNNNTASKQLTGPRLNIKTVLCTYGDFHVKDKTAVRTSYL